MTLSNTDEAAIGSAEMLDHPSTNGEGTAADYTEANIRVLEGIEAIRRLLDVARSKKVPIFYTTSPFRGTRQIKSAADYSPGFRTWDRRACEIDMRVRPLPSELVIEKEHASAFAATPLVGHLIDHRVDTLLITGCSTSACVRATATDAKSNGLRPIIVREPVEDRSEIAHECTLFDILPRFAAVVSLDETLAFLKHFRRVNHERRGIGKCRDDKSFKAAGLAAAGVLGESTVAAETPRDRTFTTRSASSASSTPPALSPRSAGR